MKFLIVEPYPLPILTPLGQTLASGSCFQKAKYISDHSFSKKYLNLKIFGKHLLFSIRVSLMINDC